MKTPCAAAKKSTLKKGTEKKPKNKITIESKKKFSGRPQIMYHFFQLLGTWIAFDRQKQNYKEHDKHALEKKSF
jgi:flagellar hook-associated protein FlgK